MTKSHDILARLEEINQTPIDQADEAINQIDRLLNDVYEIDDATIIAKVNIALARFYWLAKRHEQAIRKFEEMETFMHPLPLGKDHVLISQHLGHIYLDLGVHDRALEYYYDMHQIATQLENDKFIAAAIGNIGLIRSRLGDYDQAIESHKLVMDVAKRINNRLMLVQSHYFLAVEYLNAKRPQQAIEVAEATADLETVEWEELRFQNILGQAYDQLGDDDLARKHYQLSLQFDDKPHFEFVKIGFWITFGKFCIKVSDYDKAIQVLKQALTTLAPFNYQKHLRDCHESLYIAYKHQEDWSQALHHHEQFHQVDKTIFNEDSDARIRQLQITHDVDQLHQINELQQHEFTALTEMKDVLLSNVSHDLKNPLTVIKTSVYMADLIVQDKKLDKRISKYLTRIDQSVDQMTSLITNVLDMARLDAISDVQLTPQNLEQLVNMAIDQLTEQASHKAITLKNTIDKNMVVLSDIGLLIRAIENILSNAIKYSPSHKTIHIEATYQSDNQVLFVVRDEGHGIPADELEHIFERFYRGSATSSNETGTGLGMSIVKDIVAKHKGQISISSVVGAGTTVEIQLLSPPHKTNGDDDKHESKA